MSIEKKEKRWTPSEITTAAWFDASDTDTITESGGKVAKWDDKSGNHMVQGSASNQPYAAMKWWRKVWARMFDAKDRE